MEARLLHQDGVLRMAQGDHSTAHETLEAAARIFRGLGARLDMERVEQVLVNSIAEHAFRA
jgi:flagellin-specific chaperone FliS